MSKTKNDAPTAIEAGKAITITADSREEATEQLNELRKQAEEAGLVQDAGGFIEYCKQDYLDKGKFCATVTFNKL